MAFDLPPVEELVVSALAEDLGVRADAFFSAGAALLDRDATSSLVPSGRPFRGAFVAREAAVVCGLPVVARVFSTLAEAAGPVDETEMFPLVAEGGRVEAGTAVAEVTGPARLVLACERTAVDFLAVLSGIASESARWRDAAPPRLAVLDTRKTLPGLRALSKYAVRVGGAENHRQGLWDMVLVKDNHLDALGGIAPAVQEARARHPGLPVEVEADSVEQAREAARSRADIVLLDNMDDAQVAEAVAAVREEAGDEVLVEVSGRVSIDRLPALEALGVDRVSTSALAMARPLDFGLDERAG